MVKQHHVVLYHSDPVRLRIVSGAWWIFDPLQSLTLCHVGEAAVKSGFFAVPKYEPDGSLCLHIGTAEDSGDLHDERGAGTIVVGGLAIPYPVHVSANDIHLVRPG